MSAIAKLIRYHKFELDQKRRRLRELEERQEEASGRLEALAAEVRAEQEAARNMGGMTFDYGAYARWTIERRQTLEKALTEIQAMVDRARDDLVRAFEELKKYEITKTARDLAEARDAAQKEQVFLDEVALNLHRRRDGNG